MNLKIQLLKFLIIISSNYVVCDESTTETTQGQNQSVCLDFIPFNESCSYSPALPFDQYKDIMESEPDIYMTNIAKNPKYDYYQWTESLGNYGKLFVENFTDSGGGNYVIANFSTSNITYFTYDNISEFNHICAYDSFQNERNRTYCKSFDMICTNGSSAALTENCHCQNSSQAYFCELKCYDCNDTCYNASTCNTCEEIFEKYKEPSIRLSFNYYTRSIYVSVFSYLKLAPVNVSDVCVYCYTDARTNLHDVTYRYEYTDIVDYNITNYKNIYYTIYPQNDSIGHYWCEGFKFGQNDLVNVASNRIIADNSSAESFTMNITVNDTTRTYPFSLHEETCETIKEILNLNNLSIITDVRFLNLYEKNSTTQTTKLAYRLYTSETNLTDILNKTSEAFSKQDDVTVDVGPSYCQHSITTNNNRKLTWKKTLVGMRVIPEEFCLQNNSKPVTRTCQGEYLYGVYWSDVDGSCSNVKPKNSIELYNLTKETANLTKLSTILTSKRQDHIPVDAHFMAQILENVSLSNDSVDIQELIQVVSDIMDLNRTVLTDAQVLLNSTDIILYNLDAILSNHITSNYTIIIKKNIFVQVSDFSTSNITGTAVYETNNNVFLQPLRHDYNLSDLDIKDLKLVVFFTGTQLEQVMKSNTKARLVITVFRHDSLFNNGSYPSTIGYLVGLHVTGFEEPFLYDSVKIIITPDRKYRADLLCHHWEFGRDKLWYNRYGEWKYDTKAETVDYFTDSYQCKQDKLNNKIVILSGAEAEIILSVVAAVGCALSMFGSMAVIVTGLIYKHWRENSGTKILLNFVLTNFTQNIILAASSGIDSYKQIELCIATGAALHYSVVSQFTWMVIIGYLQYERYVRVFYTVSTRFVLLSSVAAWIVPTVPVITVLVIDDFEHSAYVQQKFCYLQDKKLMYGVYLPVALTLTSSTFIFTTILVNIYCLKKMTISVRDSISWLNLRLVVLLFFLLGFYWVFGIAARFTDLVAFDYFFCISAAMQGIVIFLYFIVFNKMTRNFWLKQLKRSEMITTMQIWLQQRQKIGKVKLIKRRIKNEKSVMIRTLKMKNQNAKLA